MTSRPWCRSPGCPRLLSGLQVHRPDVPLLPCLFLGYPSHVGHWGKGGDGTGPLSLSSPLDRPASSLKRGRALFLAAAPLCPLGKKNLHGLEYLHDTCACHSRPLRFQCSSVVCLLKGRGKFSWHLRGGFICPRFLFTQRDRKLNCNF